MINFKKFNNIISLTSCFTTDAKCKQAIIESRWSDGDIVCPYCGGHHCVTCKEYYFQNESKYFASKIVEINQQIEEKTRRINSLLNK